MKILAVSSRPPWPPVMADAMTVDRLLRFLSSRGHEVDLVCFVENEAQDRALREALGSVCHRIETVLLPKWHSYLSTALTLPGSLPMQVQYFRSEQMHARIDSLVESKGYDVVYTHLIRMSEYTRRLPVPRALGMQISQGLNLSRMHDHVRDPFRKLFYGIEAAKTRRYEAEVAADFDRVFLCGQSDIDAIEQTAKVPNAVINPHGQDVPLEERVRAAVREPDAIVVTGVMSTYTNVDAVSWFAKDVFPRIERRLPDARFWIVGRNPQRGVRALARPPRIEVTGEVPDVYAWLCRASVAVAPLRIGAGMQNKIVQAMACELPVVATTVANEGIGAVDGEQILLRDDAESMAEAVTSLLRDPGRSRAIGRAARAYILANWTWEALFERQEKVLAEIAGRGAPTAL
jgi:glycosyltransferase involved in cell wall biosynthesis